MIGRQVKEFIQQLEYLSWIVTGVDVALYLILWLSLFHASLLLAGIKEENLSKSLDIQR